MFIFALGMTCAVGLVETYRTLKARRETKKEIAKVNLELKEQKAQQTDLAIMKLRAEVEGLKDVIGYAKSLEQMNGDDNTPE